MYRLKQIPEDFIVREHSTVPIKGRGKYLYFRLWKKSMNTLDAVSFLAQRLHVLEKSIGVAGSKDKNAVTEQVCSIAGVSKERLLSISHPLMKITIRGYGGVPISLGDLESNEFEIVARNIDSSVTSKIRLHFPLRFIPNYFDEQRFSSNNAVIGKCLVKKEFKEACMLIDDANVQHHLAEHPNDYIGSLKQQPIRLLRMYVNAYQSYLWNELLANYLRQHSTVVGTVRYSQGEFVFVNQEEQFSDLVIPIPGFGTELVLGNESPAGTVRGELKEMMISILHKEGITFSDFVIKQIPELTLEGELRPAIIDVHNFVAQQPEADDLNSGKLKQKFSFFLRKGSYATMVIKRFFVGIPKDQPKSLSQ